MKYIPYHLSVSLTEWRSYITSMCKWVKQVTLTDHILSDLTMEVLMCHYDISVPVFRPFVWCCHCLFFRECLSLMPALLHMNTYLLTRQVSTWPGKGGRGGTWSQLGHCQCPWCACGGGKEPCAQLRAHIFSSLPPTTVSISKPHRIIPLSMEVAAIIWPQTPWVCGPTTGNGGGVWRHHCSRVPNNPPPTTFSQGENRNRCRWGPLSLFHHTLYLYFFGWQKKPFFAVNSVSGMVSPENKCFILPEIWGVLTQHFFRSVFQVLRNWAIVSGWC